MDDWLDRECQWIFNANALELARGIDVLRREEHGAFLVGYFGMQEHLQMLRGYVAKQCAPWFEQ